MNAAGPTKPTLILLEISSSVHCELLYWYLLTKYSGKLSLVSCASLPSEFPSSSEPANSSLAPTFSAASHANFVSRPGL